MAEYRQEVSEKIHNTISSIHRAFMQPRKSEGGESSRKKYWLDAWLEIKKLSPSELEELSQGIETIQSTLGKLKIKIESLRTKKLKVRAERHSLENLNEWEDDEFLDSSAALPVFNPKEKKGKGKLWVMTQSMEKPKTVSEICQAVWTVITNRAIYIVDKGRTDAKPSPSRDLMVEKHRLAVLPYFLDDKTITDTVTGKPLMNLYMITPEVKETLLWLLADRAKNEKVFRILYIKFLYKEVLKKAKLFDWAAKFTPHASAILKEIEHL
ncbi:MAG: hypothetical protein HUU50_07100 [Candidatus Brocadiae bacterium]|nr:hypothetical protein [Candidatus Brocadiia bacterium]